MVDPDTERRAIALFQQLIDVPEADRDAWIARMCGNDDRLRSRLNAMRAADRAPSLRTGAAVDELEEEAAPDRIGAYRITALIGRGGMGSVYRGERATGDFAHVVAIKIIKPGLLSETLIDRFQRERQTLAALSHPNIAQLHDGGETQGGSPYIAMELVDGLPLLQWADAHHASRERRLRLFVDMCAGVGFAHRNLVVHRDLTPSNVLVTHDGTPKLIDFGIAKPTDLDEDDGATASIVSLSLTPGFAAPERMIGARATTATDIYSLGRVLERLVPPARGDAELAAIVACATADDPARRYATVAAMADDIAALREGRPVAAMRGGKRYRARKFVRRYRVAVGAATLAVIALVLGLGVSLHAYARAEAARQAEAARFAELRSLAGYMLFDLNDRLERVVGNNAARADLARRAQGYLSSLAHSPRADAPLRYEAAVGLIRLARIQGVPREPNLGQTAQARANLATAERLLTGLNDDLAVPARAALAEAQALRSVAYLHGEGDPARAAPLLAAAQRSLTAAPPQGAAWAQARRTLRKAELDHADLGDRAKDLPGLADALEADIARWPAARRGGHDERLDRAYAVHYRALARMIGGDAAGSVPLFLDTERRFDALVRQRPDDPLVLYLRAYNAAIGFGAASQAGQEGVSGRLIVAARTSIDRLLRLEPNDAAVQALAANIKEGQSQDLRDKDRFAEAVALQREVVEDRRHTARHAPSGRADGNLGFSLSILGVIARNARNRDLACVSWRESEAKLSALERRKKLVGFFAGYLPGLRANLALCDAGRPVSAFRPLR